MLYVYICTGIFFYVRPGWMPLHTWNIMDLLGGHQNRSLPLRPPGCAVYVLFYWTKKGLRVVCWGSVFYSLNSCDVPVDWMPLRPQSKWVDSIGCFVWAADKGWLSLCNWMLILSQQMMVTISIPDGRLAYAPFNTNPRCEWFLIRVGFYLGSQLICFNSNQD